MADPYFFGYGSLVNTATHDFPDPSPARAQGWRRGWRHSGGRAYAFLTAVAEPGAMIEGMIARVPGRDWAALDAREWAYDRVRATDQVRHALPQPAEIALYVVPETRHETARDCFPVLQSYLDVVVQGYLRVFGPDGVVRFFETTDGWDIPVLQDRGEPRYPRHQALSAQERAVVDDGMDRVGARRIAP